MREAEYRANFLIGAGEGVAQLALAVLSFLLLYRFTDTVAGWTQAEVLMLVGMYRIIEGLINLQIAPNMQAISGYIRRGEMDDPVVYPGDTIVVDGSGLSKARRDILQALPVLGIFAGGI